MDLYDIAIARKLSGGSGGGGGGSSDFSTAEVTIVDNWGMGELIGDNCPTLDLENNLLNGSFYLDGTQSSVTFLVPLYKGKCYWEYVPPSFTLAGNVENFWDGLLITGDCTITIS